MKKILYIYPIKTSFVKSDLQILSSVYKVKPFSFAVSHKIFTPIAFLKQLFFLLFQLPGAAFVVSQFSGYHSFLPSVFCRLFGRKHFIIVHGTECNNFPEYNYGYASRPALFWFSKKSLALASGIFPVSEALVEQSYTYKETTYVKQGLRAFYPNLHTPVTVIHNGVLTDRFNLMPDVKRVKNSFVTVATGLDDSNRRGIKGLDLVSALAEKLPESKFTFIGGSMSSEMTLPKNIEVVAAVPNEELQRIYNQHEFYLQLSVSEGFGIAVVESMMCGCIPIVSDVGVLPEIVDTYGFVLKQKDPDQLLELVRKASEGTEPVDLSAMRESVVKRFSIENRVAALLASFDQES